MRPVLITTVHDPTGRLLDAACGLGDLLEIYEARYFRCTESTDRALLEQLGQLGDVSFEAPNLIGQARRETLRLARADGAETIIYCDFDRWLHWASRYFQELAEVPKAINSARPDAWYVCLGRTERAFATHPQVQRRTEDLSNQVISLLAGRPLDATAGACWMTARAADIVLKSSIESSNATDLEWPALIAVQDPDRLSGRRTEGLEFETATFHAREINESGGLGTWLSINYDQPHVWEARTRLMVQSIRAALRVFDAAARNGAQPG